MTISLKMMKIMISMQFHKGLGFDHLSGLDSFDDLVGKFPKTFSSSYSHTPRTYNVEKSWTSHNIDDSLQKIKSQNAVCSNLCFCLGSSPLLLSDT